MQVAQEILRQLQANFNLKMVFFSWGPQAIKALAANDKHSGGILFKVNGHLFKGHVKITLSPADLYDVEFGHLSKGSFSSKKRIEGVFCEDLSQIIDSNVETKG